jgi:RNA polymerase sporulation-specific sigma factor
MEAIVEPISLYEPVFNESGDSLYVIDQLSDTSESEERWHENVALREALETLGPREKNIIIRRFYNNKTQTEVANEIGISQAQVSRLEKGAILKLRKCMQA